MQNWVVKAGRLLADDYAVNPQSILDADVAHFDESVGDSTAFCILRSVWETSKLNGINPFDTLRLAFEGR